MTSTQHELVECDLSHKRFISELEDLQENQIKQVQDSIDKIEKMTWDQVYKTSSRTQKRGINWEKIAGQTTRSGKPVASIRVSKKYRARVCRDGKIMRFISLHLDHDGTYKEPGNDDV